MRKFQLSGRLIKKLVIIGCVLSIYGCGLSLRYSKMMDGWRGKPVSEVIQHKDWGPATKVTPDGQGGMVYSWLRTNYIYHFYVNADGIIYTWRWDVYDYRGRYI